RQHVGRGVNVEPDRRFREAALRRGGHAGARPGRRAPGGRRAHRARPRLRGWIAVLLDVDRPQRAAVTPAARRPPREAAGARRARRGARRTEGAMHFNIADLFESIVDRVPARTALVCGAQRRTYAQLEERGNRLAHALAARGVGQGDHVALYMTNCAEYVEAMVACFKIRAVPINVNFRYVEDELRYLLDDSQSVAVLHTR